MASKPLPSREVLDILFLYDPDTGNLYWKARPSEMFSDGVRPRDSARMNARKWNKRFAGKAITTALPTGYIYTTIWAKKVLVHRVIWKLMNGTDADTIDHINGNPADNRLANLRSVKHQENGRNQKLRKNNTSGVQGVGWLGLLNKWHAKIQVGPKTVHIGVYDDFDEAVAARRDAEHRFGFHENHGQR